MSERFPNITYLFFPHDFLKRFGIEYVQCASSWRLFRNPGKPQAQVLKNCIWNLPDEIANLIGLMYFEANNISLTELPLGISALQCLRQLHLSGNSINWLPKEFFHLTNLEYVDLSYNTVTILDGGTKCVFFSSLFCFK